MANNLRHRHGPQLLVKCAVEADTVIEAGDLVWLDTDGVKPASAFPWTSDLATTQAAFAAKFVGVAQEPSAAGQTAEISVDVSPLAVYEMAAASAAYEVGDTLGPDQTGTGSTSALADQQLEQAAGAASVARCVKRSATAKETVEVIFASAYFAGNAHAAIG